MKKREGEKSEKVCRDSIFMKRERERRMRRCRDRCEKRMRKGVRKM
jgi:hypothetical protein